MSKLDDMLDNKIMTLEEDNQLTERIDNAIANFLKDMEGVSRSDLLCSLARIEQISNDVSYITISK